MATITRRGFAKKAGAGVAALAAGPWFWVPNPAAARPNVLFIAVDDMNHWVGYLKRNAQTKTPNLDRLAARGVSFTRSYCAAPVCNPSRAALMSGMRPSTTGVYENPNDWRTVIPIDKPLTTAFRNAGYSVLGTGKIYHEAWPRREEWDDYLGPDDLTQDARGRLKGGVGGIRFEPLTCRDDELRDYKFCDFTIERLRRKHDKPFFLACGFQIPHMPWGVPQKWFDLFPVAGLDLPPYKENDLDDVPPAGKRMAKPDGDHAAMLASGRWKEAIQAYLACIAYTDMNLGRLLEAFDASSYRDNTIIVLWSDHGWHLGEKHHWRKFALWEEATRSPLIWVAPGVTKPGGICERSLDFMTIYPTLCDLCRLPVPSHVEGRSIRGILENPRAPWDAAALMTYRFKNHAVRTEGWRYIRYENGDEELYDETKDPYEWVNLAAKSEFAGRKAEMAKRLPKRDQPDIGGRPGAGAE